MPDFYLDSRLGNDANGGGSASSPKRGTTPDLIRTLLNAAPGTTVHLAAGSSWDNQSLVGLTQADSRIVVYGDGEVLLDGRTRLAGGWTNVLGSKVWKRTVSRQVHRVLFAPGSNAPFAEGNDVAKTVLTNLGGSANAAATPSESAIVAALDVGVSSIVKQRMWYWSGATNTLYVLSNSSSVDPDTAYGGVWMVSGGYADAGFNCLTGTGLRGLNLGPRVRMRGYPQPIRLFDVTGTISPWADYFAHYNWETCYISTSTDLVIADFDMRLARPKIDEYYSVDQYNDGNGIRTMGGCDLITLLGTNKNTVVRDGYLEGCWHSGVTTVPWATHNGLLVSRVEFDGRLARYARAFQIASGGGVNIRFEDLFILGMPTNSQIAGGNCVVDRCVVRGVPGQSGNVVGNLEKYDKDYYWQRTQNAAGITFQWYNGSYSDAWVRNCLIVGCEDPPITALSYGATCDPSRVGYQLCRFERGTSTAPNTIAMYTNGISPSSAFSMQSCTFGGLDKVHPFDGGSEYPIQSYQYGSGNRLMTTAERTQAVAESLATKVILPKATDAIPIGSTDYLASVVDKFNGNAPVVGVPLTVTTSDSSKATGAMLGATTAAGQAVLRVQALLAGTPTITARPQVGAASASIVLTTGASTAGSGSGSGTGTSTGTSGGAVIATPAGVAPYTARTNKRYYSVNGSSLYGDGTKDKPWRTPYDKVSVIPADCEHIFLDPTWNEPNADGLLSFYGGRPVLPPGQTFRSDLGYLGTRLVGNGSQCLTLDSDPNWGDAGTDIEFHGLDFDTGWGGSAIAAIGGRIRQLRIRACRFGKSGNGNTNQWHVFYLVGGASSNAVPDDIDIGWNIVDNDRNCGFVIHLYHGEYFFAPTNVRFHDNRINWKGWGGALISPMAGGWSWDIVDNDWRITSTDPRDYSGNPVSPSVAGSVIDLYDGVGYSSGGQYVNGVDPTFRIQRNSLVLVAPGGVPVIRKRTVAGSGSQHNPTISGNKFWNGVDTSATNAGVALSIGDAVADPGAQPTTWSSSAGTGGSGSSGTGSGGSSGSSGSTSGGSSGGTTTVTVEVVDWSPVAADSGGNRWLLPSVTSPSVGGGPSTGPATGDGTVVAVVAPRAAGVPEKTALFTAEDFLRAMQALLPRGRVWPRDPDATQTRLLQGLVQVYDANTARALQLLADAFPSLTVELLAEWEQTLGLPDPCAGDSPTLQQRRAQVVARLVDAGGQSAAYFKSLAADLGYDVTVTNNAQFRVGQSHVGEHVGGDAWAFTWAVRAALITIGQFRAGQSAVGEPLQAWGNTVLECEVGERAPAHSIVQFQYT